MDNRSKTPLVSVVIPTHSRRAMVERAIESVRRQTFADWELVVVDDASNDGTAEYLDELSQTEPRLRVIRQESASGGTAARNLGMRSAKGEWVACLDDDDEWRPRWLELAVERARSYESKSGRQLGLVYGWYVDRYADGGEKVNDRTFEGDVLEALLTNYFGIPSSLFIRREVFETVGFITEDFTPCEEWDFMIRVSREWDVACVAEVMATVHKHDGPRMTDLSMMGHREFVNRHEATFLRHGGPELLAMRRVFSGSMIRGRGKWGVAAGEFWKAIQARPCCWGAWWRLVSLPLWRLFK